MPRGAGRRAVSRSRAAAPPPPYTLLEAARALLPALAEVTDAMSPDAFGGGVLLGVKGVCVVGHGASSPRAVASCLAVAAQAATEGLVPATEAALADLLERRAQVAG